MFILKFRLPAVDDFEYISADHKGRFTKWVTRFGDISLHVEYSTSGSPIVIQLTNYLVMAGSLVNIESHLFAAFIIFVLYVILYCIKVWSSLFLQFYLFIFVLIFCITMFCRHYDEPLNDQRAYLTSIQHSSYHGQPRSPFSMPIFT